jgi:thymidylate synthase (FAD)
MYHDLQVEKVQAGGDELLIAAFAEKKMNLIKQVLKSGHHSVLEHVQLTFLVSGITRAASHQLVRHRLASYSQQSQRYVEFKNGKFDYVIPYAIKRDEQLKETFENLMQQISEAYATFTEAGVKAEDARSVLPNATCTNIVVTMNLREFIHFCNERLCTCAQGEIREMTIHMVDAATRKFPYLASYFTPKCEVFGYCNESAKRSCGRKKLRAEVLGEG